jgi:photosynthetic reaction center cytochrome c subunit
MKRTWITGMVSGLALVLTGWTGGASRTPSQQAPPAAAAPAHKEPSTQEINDAFVQQISKQIAGHEQEPAEKVFKNVQIMKTVPAARFLLIMNLGYARGLGVTCEHCHVKEDFSKDDKRPKRAAREMAVMHRSINDQLVKMQNLEPNPNGHFINCSTCHRGQIDPMAEPN